MRRIQFIITVSFLFCSITTSPVKKVDDIGNNTTNLSNDYGLLGHENDNNHNINSRSPDENDEDDSKIPMKGRSGIVRRRKERFWPNATIPYIIDRSDYTKEEVGIIMESINTIHYWTCVRFVPHSGQRDYVVILHRLGSACGSETIGRKTGMQVVLLEAPICLIPIGHAIHELLHVIGLIHENSRPDSSDYVSIKIGNTIPNTIQNFYTDLSTEDYGVPYDYNSVMHYPLYALSLYGPTVIPTKDDARYSKMGQRAGLSFRDAIKINNMYNCFYKINYEKNYSRLLPGFYESGFWLQKWTKKAWFWNIYLRDLNYTDPLYVNPQQNSSSEENDQ